MHEHLENHMRELKLETVQKHLLSALKSLASIPIIHTTECTRAGKCRCWRQHVDQAMDDLQTAQAVINGEKRNG